jgi:hypothetical protein
MSEFKFVLQGESFPVGRLVAQQACDVLAHVGQVEQFSV